MASPQSGDSIRDTAEVIDIGGEKFQLNANQSVDMSHKSYADFKKTFGSDARTEELLLKYLPFELNRKIVFLGKQGMQDKEELIKILKKRAAALKASADFNSQTLIHGDLKRIHANILRLLLSIEAPDAEAPSDLSEKCQKDLHNAREMSNITKKPNQEKIFKSIIALAWYLLNPGKVPTEIQCEWASILQQLDTIGIKDIVGELQMLEKEKGLTATEKPLNYFKSMNVTQLKGRRSMKNVGDSIKNMVGSRNDSADKIKAQLVRLLKLLEMKKYLARKNEDVPTVTNQEYRTMNDHMIENLFSGGASANAVTPFPIKSLYAGMSVVYRPLRAMYNPIYDFLDASTKQSNSNNGNSKTTIRQVMLPEVWRLLHVMQEIAKRKSHGIYRLRGVLAEMRQFIASQCTALTQHLAQIENPDDKTVFLKQLLALPEIRMSSILKTNGGVPVSTSQPAYLQCLLLNENMTMMNEDAFVRADTPGRTKDTYDALVDFFTADALYVLCTSEKGSVTCDIACTVTLSHIVMNVFDVDMRKVDVDQALTVDELSDHYFRRDGNKIPEMTLDTLMELQLDKLYTDTELFLSALLMFKERMPK